VVLVDGEAAGFKQIGIRPNGNAWCKGFPKAAKVRRISCGRKLRGGGHGGRDVYLGQCSGQHDNGDASAACGGRDDRPYQHWGDLAHGQLIRAYGISVQVKGSNTWQPFSNGTSVRHKKIDVLPQGVAPVLATAVRLTVMESGGPPRVKLLAAFAPCERE
jgi:hypothetical protein